jgi:hypothetical protein
MKYYIGLRKCSGREIITQNLRKCGRRIGTAFMFFNIG